MGSCIRWSISPLNQAARILFGVIFAMLRSLGVTFQPRCLFLPENLARRHQLLVLRCTAGKPRFRNVGRRLWICLRAVWSH
jgi:hypothetical protein